MILKRRTFLLGSAGLMLASGLPAWADEGAPVVLDFGSSLPPGFVLNRRGPALARRGDAYALVGADEPRFEAAGAEGTPALLIEGTSGPALDPIGDASGENGPDGATPSVGLGASAPTVEIPVAAFDRLVTASVFVRTAEAARWRIAVRSPYIDQTSAASADVGPSWTRLSVTRPSYVSEPDPLEFHLRYEDEEGGGSFGGPAWLWGATIDEGVRATSPVPAGERRREADELLVNGAIFRRDGATVVLHLPAGGTRGSTLLDGEDDDFRLGYDNSGRLVARIGSLAAEGVEDATVDTVVAVRWSGKGVAIASGRAAGDLKERASAIGNPGTPRCGATVRVLARQDGTSPANTHLARIEIRPEAAPVAPLALPAYVPAEYRLAFADEFDDPDTLRINEDGRRIKPGPAWRSRFRWSRFDVVNQEKQIYMDRGFAGSGGEPLGIDPFRIENGVLTISARRTDPAVGPLIKDAVYTSGMISSQNSHAQTYGYFEIRCRVPAGRGFWPAFWLVPAAETWPPELDVLEASGARRFSFSTNAIGDNSPFGQLWTHDRGDLTEGFHTFALEWTRSDIVLFADGAELRRGRNFVDQPMYVIANLAVGSHEDRWIPNPDETTPAEGRFEIDFIRCWARG